jgi:hypothetical protein
VKQAQVADLQPTDFSNRRNKWCYASRRTDSCQRWLIWIRLSCEEYYRSSHTQRAVSSRTFLWYGSVYRFA